MNQQIICGVQISVTYASNQAIGKSHNKCRKY